MRLLLLIVVSMAITFPAFAQSWLPVPIATSSTIRTITKAGGFSDIYLVGDNGLVAHSDYTRLIWTVENPLTSANLHSGQRMTSAQFWASGDNGVVRVELSSNWYSRNVPNGVERFIIYSRESGCANALGDLGSLYQTCNLGVSWTALNSGVSVSLNHGAGFITSTSWIVGDGGTILKSTDGGTTWVPQNSGTTEDLHYIIEAGSGYVIVVGKGGTILRTNDGGTTWTQSVVPITTNLWQIQTSSLTGAYMLAVGDSGMLLKSLDSGATWCQLDPGTSVDLFGVGMFGTSEYIVAGENGVLRRTTDGGGPCVTPVDSPPTVDWTDQARLQAVDLVGPAILVNLNPHPEPPVVDDSDSFLPTISIGGYPPDPIIWFNLASYGALGVGSSFSFAGGPGYSLEGNTLVIPLDDGLGGAFTLRATMSSSGGESLNPASLVSFNPQPEPPALGSIVGFNPQPEPPAYNSSLGIKMELQSAGFAASSFSAAGSTITWSIEILDASLTPIALEQTTIPAVPGLSGIGVMILCGGLLYGIRRINRQRL